MIALGLAVAAATRARTEIEGSVRARHRDQRQQRDQADRREVAQRVGRACGRRTALTLCESVLTISVWPSGASRATA